MTRLLDVVRSVTLTLLVVAALLAGLGCGSDTGGKDKDKKGGTEKKEPKPDTRKDL